MANEEEVEGSVPPVKSGGFSMVPLIGAMLVAVTVALAGVGGAGYWLVRSGHLPLGPTLPSVPKVEAATKPRPRTLREVAMDPLLVNLADEGAHSYLRVTMTLVLDETDAVKPKEEKAEKGKTPTIEHGAAIRDTAFNVIGGETSSMLLAPEGKDHLKLALRDALAKQVPEIKVSDIYLTEFLVQR